MSWMDSKDLSEVDIIKKNIILLDRELREKYNLGFDYSTEDKLLDIIYDVLIEKKRLFKIKEEN